MTTTNQIREQLKRIPDGYVFTYSQFLDDSNNTEAIIKALNRFVAKGTIKKIAKGKFYKPEKSAFGLLKPSQQEIVKDLLFKEGETIGYLTGFSIYNKLGLSTQISNTIEIASNNIRPKFKRGDYTIRFIKQKNEITNRNVFFLQLLDMLRYIKKIPDTTVKESVIRLTQVFLKLEEKELSQIIKLAQKYSPLTRALLGAILMEIRQPKLALTLKKSLNPITSYQLGDLSEVLKSSNEWNIV